MQSVKKRWPHVLLQWEDFAGSNAARFLGRYRDQLCTFNDDIQGTAAIATATLISAINVTGVPARTAEDRRRRLRKRGHRHYQSSRRSSCRTAASPEVKLAAASTVIDRHGLITENSKDLRPEQLALRAQGAGSAGWRQPNGEIPLLDVVRNAKPTVLIGVSGQGGAFTEHAVREMAKHTRSAGDLSAFEPDVAKRSDSSGLDELDRRTSANRHRHGHSIR